MSRGNFCVEPPPGTSPIATSGWPKIALPAAAKHMSMASAISLPPPRARPDFGNGCLGHVPESLADRLRKTKTRCMRHHFGSGSNPAQTRVGNKEIRKRALHDYNPDALIDLEFPA